MKSEKHTIGKRYFSLNNTLNFTQTRTDLIYVLVLKSWKIKYFSGPEILKVRSINLYVG